MTKVAKETMDRIQKNKYKFGECNFNSGKCDFNDPESLLVIFNRLEKMYFNTLKSHMMQKIMQQVLLQFISI